MSDVSLQIYAAAVCALTGAAGGVLYECVSVFRFFVKNKIAGAAADVVFFILFALVFVWARTFFCIPAFRIYMLAFAAFGFLLYRKSLHRILAFFARRLYNKCRSGSKKAKSGPSLGNEG